MMMMMMNNKLVILTTTITSIATPTLTNNLCFSFTVLSVSTCTSESQLFFFLYLSLSIWIKIEFHQRDHGTKIDPTIWLLLWSSRPRFPRQRREAEHVRTSPRHRCKCWGRDTCVVFGFRLDQSGFFSENLFFSFFKEVGIFMICLMRFAYSKYLLNFTLFRFNSIIIHYHYISYYTAYTFILLIIIILIFELRKENLKRITHMYHSPPKTCR